MYVVRNVGAYIRLSSNLSGSEEIPYEEIFDPPHLTYSSTVRDLSMQQRGINFHHIAIVVPGRGNYRPEVTLGLQVEHDQRCGHVL